MQFDISLPWVEKVSFRSEAAFKVLVRDVDVGLAAHNRSFATKKKTPWHPG